MDKIEYVVGDAEHLEKMSDLSAWHPFDERVFAFFNELSARIIKAPQTKQYPDMTTLAFWLRRGNVRAVADKYPDCSERLGRGLTFHIAPGNVALSFVYSLIIGLIAGNTNIVRMPSRRFEQAEILCDILRDMLIEDSYKAFRGRVCLIKYPHDKDITDKLSAVCHTRIIWGGDQTIATIRQSPLSPRANEITFANRFSLALINADKYLSEYDSKKTARDFYIDTYLSDQNACSSPRIVFWFGDKVDEAKSVFWRALYEHLNDYDMAPVTTVDKLMIFSKFAAENDCKITHEPDYKMLRVSLDKIDKSVLDCIGNSGYFYEYNLSDIAEIIPLCTWECQTLSYIGFDGNELRKFVLASAPSGIDRIVPVGETMEFSLEWDGYDLIGEMSRKISVI
jgi:hypothetical protein